MPQQINGASIDITEYDGRPQDQQLEESDESYLWFLKYLANVNWSIADIISECMEMRDESKSTGERGHTPAETTVYSWASKHDWQKRRAIYNKLHLDPIREKMADDRHAQFEIFFQNELDLAIKEQKRIESELDNVERNQNIETRASVRFRNLKAYEIIRTIIKEDLGTHVLLERLKQAEGSD